jgi:drug/metabolite transporter (DMT)-like permease
VAGVTTAVALLCFAANSILCRLALGARTIDPANFTCVRLAAGAVVLWVIHRARSAASRRASGWRAPAALFVYAAAFSFAYVSLAAGSGALILFGAVQSTMLIGALRAGERFRPLEAGGLALAIAGLLALLLPGWSAPSPLGWTLMTTAGIAWGVYSMIGRGSADPLADTARNFAIALLPGLAAAAIAWPGHHVSTKGVALAAISGAITSGLGYVVWYRALRTLTAIRAATVQLSVPAIAAAGGVMLLGERVTMRLLLCGAMILGGVAIAIAARTRKPATS